MNASWMKLNKDKTRFIWLGTLHSCLRSSARRFISGSDIQMSTEVTCLGVLLDSKLTFTTHVRWLSGKCSYHLVQLKTVCWSLSEDAAMSHWYMHLSPVTSNSIIATVSSMVHVQFISSHCRCAYCSMQQLNQLMVHKWKYDHITSHDWHQRSTALVGYSTGLGV